MADTKSSDKSESSPRSEPKPDTLTVVLRAANDQAQLDVIQHALCLGAQAASGKGSDKVSVLCPAESVRNPSDRRQKLVDGLSASPLVAEVS